MSCRYNYYPVYKHAGEAMIRSHHKFGLFLCVLVLFFAAQNAMAANYYVYQLPDGTRMITDRPQQKYTHKLIKKSRESEGVGQVAAVRYQKRPKALDQWDAEIIHVSNRYNVEVELVKAVIHTESYFNHKAQSRAGAQGLMQLMPQTAAIYGVTDPYDPVQNLDAGVQHLSYLLEKYPDNISYALAAYNAGERAVYFYNGVPPYQETQRYVNKVLHYRDFYRTVN